VKIAVPYGNETLVGELPSAQCLGVLDIADVPELPNRDRAIANAIDRPVALERNIYEIVSPGETVAILVSDAFRKTGVDLILPILLKGLNNVGICDEAISFFFATGTHRGPTQQEQAEILGVEMLERFQGRVHIHDPEDTDNLVKLGVTSRGTPVLINRGVHEHQRIIATGAVVLHYFGGYGGGRKSIVPGISGIETISHNHAMNLDPHSDRLNPHVRIGVLDGNPVAEDMLEAARFAKIDCIINTVLNRQGRIAGVFAGELDVAHRAAARFAEELYTVNIDQRADLVVASAGANANFVQSHKALYNAYQALKPGGRIVFAAICNEGLGGEQFAKWLRLSSRDAIIERLRKQSEINGQTALSSIEKAPCAVFVTELTDDEVRLLGGNRAQGFQDALDSAAAQLRAQGIATPSCYVMPSAAYTVPQSG